MPPSYGLSLGLEEEKQTTKVRDWEEMGEQNNCEILKHLNRNKEDLT